MGGIANNPIANAPVAPIAQVVAKKTEIPQGIAQIVVVFALTKLLSAATEQGAQGRFDPAKLVNKLATDSKVTTKYLKDTGLDQKAATKSLQQTQAVELLTSMASAKRHA